MSRWNTLAEPLAHYAATRPDAVAFRFLAEGRVHQQLTFAGLKERADTVAAAIERRGLVGQRILLVYPPGLELIPALLGCVQAGAIAVPAYPPDPTRLERTLPRMQAIAQSCGAALAMSDTVGCRLVAFVGQSVPELSQLPWIASDELPPGTPQRALQAGGPDDVAFVQFTSGSCSLPKGVTVRHRQVLANCQQMHARLPEGLQRHSHFVSWVPLYHDLGLVMSALYTVIQGTTATLMSPLDFLRDPLSWLEAISRFRGSVTGAPCFAYDLCARRATPERLASLDLSCLRMAVAGGEPNRKEAFDNFQATFGPRGFSPHAFFPCYGLAETVVAATGDQVERAYAATAVDAAALGAGRFEPALDSTRRRTTLVSAGAPLSGVDLRIVDPVTLRPCGAGEVGEIWLASAAVASGYWELPEDSQAVFGATLADGQGPFLRTGDLGAMHAGELYITGRRKDTLIVRGRNLFPQDLEHTAETAHPDVRPGGAAAFSIEGAHGEEICLVQELRARDQTPDYQAVARSIRLAIAASWDVTPGRIVLIRKGTIAKTSSGKIQRKETARLLEEGALPVLFDATTPPSADAAGACAVVPAELLARVHTGSLRRRCAATLDLLTLEAARILGVEPASIAAGQPLQETGLDSLGAVELQNVLSAHLGVRIPATTVFNYPTLEKLAAHLVERLSVHAGAANTADPTVADDSAAPGPVDLSDLDSCSAEELMAIAERELDELAAERDR